MLTTTTVELLQIVPARKNVYVRFFVVGVQLCSFRTVVMKVLEMEERSFPAKREGNPPSRRLTVKLQNDEEELLKLVVWGDQINGFTDVVKVEGVSDYTCDLWEFLWSFSSTNSPACSPTKSIGPRALDTSKRKWCFAGRAVSSRSSRDTSFVACSCLMSTSLTHPHRGESVGLPFRGLS